MTNPTASINANSINRLVPNVWDDSLQECITALETCKGGSDKDRLEKLKEVIGIRYPMYGSGVVRNLAEKAVKYCRIDREVRENFLSVWLDFETSKERRVGLIGILCLAEDISIFNDVFFSKKETYEKEVRKEIFDVAYDMIGSQLGYWENLSQYMQQKEVKDVVQKVLKSYEKDWIAKRCYTAVFSLVSDAFNKRLAEFAEAEKIRLEREEKAAKEYADSLAAEQMIRAAERKAAKEREEAENLQRLAEKNRRKGERRREVFSAPSVTLSNGKKAKVLPSVDHVMLLEPSRYAVVSGEVFMRTGNGVKKDEFVSVKDETKSSAPVKTATVSAQKLPENLDELWLNKGDKTIKVHVVPSWVLGDKEATFLLKSRGYEFIAVEDKGAYKVFFSSLLICVGSGFKKATDEQKRLEKKQLAKTNRFGINLASGKNIGRVGASLLAAALA